MSTTTLLLVGAAAYLLVPRLVPSSSDDTGAPTDKKTALARLHDLADFFGDADPETKKLLAQLASRILEQP